MVIFTYVYEHPGKLQMLSQTLLIGVLALVKGALADPVAIGQFRNFAPALTTSYCSVYTTTVAAQTVTV